MKKKELLSMIESLQEQITDLRKGITEQVLIPVDDLSNRMNTVWDNIEGFVLRNTPAPDIDYRPAPAPELPKRWEDLNGISGCFLSEDSNIITDDGAGFEAEPWNRNIFASLKEAESALAMAQLSQLMKVYRGGWVPVKGKSRFAIMPDSDDELRVYQAFTHTSFLSFETEKLATQFLNNFRPLINQYFMID